MLKMNWLYFIESGKNGPIKIGIANNVVKRMDSLQIGNPLVLRVIAQIPVDGRKRAEALEKHLHRSFVGFHIRGEWYSKKINIRSAIEHFERDFQIKGAIMNKRTPNGLLSDNQVVELEIAMEANQRI